MNYSLDVVIEQQSRHQMHDHVHAARVCMYVCVHVMLSHRLNVGVKTNLAIKFMTTLTSGVCVQFLKSLAECGSKIKSRHELDKHEHIVIGCRTLISLSLSVYIYTYINTVSTHF